MRHKVELIITVEAVNTVMLCSRKMQICRHDELQRALGSGAVELWFDVYNNSRRSWHEKGETPITVLVLLEKIFNDLQSAPESKTGQT